jgi:hypothetical protein
MCVVLLTLHSCFAIPLLYYSKEKWDASGANEAVNRVTASIPQGTKEYLSVTSQQLFNRQRLRSMTVYFGIGEERPFYVEKSPALLLARVQHNSSFFYLNYMMLTALLFCLTLLISPSAIIGIAILAGLWMYVVRQTSNGPMRIYGKEPKDILYCSMDTIFYCFFIFDFIIIIITKQDFRSAKRMQRLVWVH